MQPAELSYFRPHRLRKCETETPEQAEFKKHKINVFVMTGYGRPIFVRYGDEIKCSSFLATLSAIFGKLSIFYSQSEHPSTVNKVVHKHMTIYLLKRRNISYVCVVKAPHDELLILSMLEFLNVQLLSCFTDRVNNMLQTNPTYDPTVNFSNATVNLLGSAIKTGLHSPCILLNSLPVLPLPAPLRQQLNSLMKANNEESLQIFLLLTLSHVVGVNHKKDIELHVQDVFVLLNLLQTQKSLRSSENWLTICLPGLSAEGNLFCYTSFLNEHYIVVMITDESFEKFYDFSSVCKEFKQQFLQSDIAAKATTALTKPLYDFEAGPEKMKLLKHFLVRHNDLHQVVMSSNNYFGENSRQFREILAGYSEMLRLQLIGNCSKKQKMHLERKGANCFGVYTSGVYSVFFCAVESLSLEDCKAILEILFKWLKEEEPNLFLLRYT